MSRQQWTIIGVLGTAVVLVYCLGMFFLAQGFLGQASPVAQLAEPATATPPLVVVVPTATPVLPTETRTPQATATLVIQIPTRASPTARATTVIGTRTAAASTIQKAFDQTSTAKTYRIAFDMSAKGDLTGFPGMTSINQEMSLFGMSGSVNGKNSHLVFKGVLSALFGGDVNKGFEIMSVEGQTFIKGPMPMFGAPEDKWYAASSSFKSSFGEPSQMMNTNQNVDLNGFRKTVTEQLDGRKCDVYVADKEASLGLARSINTGTTSTEDALGSLDSAETKIWICDDGYLHQLAMNLEGHDKSKPTQKMAFQIKFRVSDLNTDIKIAAPANAAPMQAPSFSFGTPTATPKK